MSFGSFSRSIVFFWIYQLTERARSAATLVLHRSHAGANSTASQRQSARRSRGWAPWRARRRRLQVTDAHRGSGRMMSGLRRSG